MWVQVCVAPAASVTAKQRLTRAHLNSQCVALGGTALDVSYSPGTRAIHLRRGQALFEVAHDADRPFIVRDGEITAQPVGTIYAVRHGDDRGTEVTVQQGRVKVAAGSSSVILRAGEQTTSNVAARQTVGVENALAWERGLLIAKMTPLSQVVAELNRRQPGLIVIASPGLGDLPVTGVFKVTDAVSVDATLDSLAAVFPVRVSRVGGLLTMLHR